MFAVYQGMFAAITVALAIGAAAERGRLLPAMVFAFCWSTIVYDPIACWTWNPNGWAASMGGYDFAGGTPVHIVRDCCLATTPTNRVCRPLALLRWLTV